MRTLFQAPILFGLLVALSGCGGAKPATTLRVSGIPDSKGTEIDALARAVESYLGKVDLRGPLEEALNVAVSNLTMDPTGFLSGHFAGKKKAMDLGITPAMVGPCDGLLPQPTHTLPRRR